MKYLVSLILIFNSVLVLAQDLNYDFEKINQKDQWDLIFEDNFSTNWKQKWTLDGLIASV